MQTDLRQLDEGGVPAVLIDLIYKSFIAAVDFEAVLFMDDNCTLWMSSNITSSSRSTEMAR